MENTKDKVFILNFEGEIEYIGEFEDFDYVEDYLNETGKIANWIFFQDAFEVMLNSIELAKKKAEGK